MLNRAILMGRLTRDPELRQTPNNVSVATFHWQSIGIIKRIKIINRLILSILLLGGILLNLSVSILPRDSW